MLIIKTKSGEYVEVRDGANGERQLLAESDPAETFIRLTAEESRALSQALGAHPEEIAPGGPGFSSPGFSSNSFTGC
jgi:hypothetical protein